MAKKNDSLGDRMKGYEGVSRNFLTRRVPAIIRLDGKAFHTFTKGMEKPFDLVLTQAMQETMKHLCENIQGCVLGYTQSDEITLVLTDYATIQTDAWFGYNIQKMCSVSASMATMAFNREFERIAEDWFHDNGPYWKSIGVDVDVDLTIYKRYNAYQKKMFTAMFDSRVFSVPKEEVSSYLKHWCEIKNTQRHGEAGLQLSINSTSDDQREAQFAGKSLSLREIANIASDLPMPVGRKYTLNFAVTEATILDAKVLDSLFDRDKFIVKITPIHQTKAALEHNFDITTSYDDYSVYDKFEQPLLDLGWDVIVFVPSKEEDSDRITCGNALISEV